MPRNAQPRIDQLLQAAIEVFAVAGPEGARVDAIARAAGMNKRLLYHYVGDKEALFDAATRAAVQRLAGAEIPDGDPSAWRMLCHACAVGRCPDLQPLIDALAGTAPEVVARRLIELLLPPLGAALAQKDSPRPEPDARSKPRIKLRPTIARGREPADG